MLTSGARVFPEASAQPIDHHKLSSIDILNKLLKNVAVSVLAIVLETRGRILDI
jgi:hypothetical protein